MVTLPPSRKKPPIRCSRHRICPLLFAATGAEHAVGSGSLDSVPNCIATTELSQGGSEHSNLCWCKSPPRRWCGIQHCYRPKKLDVYGLQRFLMSPIDRPSAFASYSLSFHRPNIMQWFGCNSRFPHLAGDWPLGLFAIFWPSINLKTCLPSPSGAPPL